VWESDLSFIAHPTDLTVEENLAGWTQALAEDPARREVITTVRGVPALTREPTVDTPSALIWLESGLELSFYSPTHTVDQLRQLADQLTYGA
jgi:hypothetical protein